MHLLSLDPVSVTTGLLIGFFLSCLVWLVFLRDPASAPSRPVTRTVWCPTHEQRATVDFIEEVKTGMLERRVMHCSLKESGVHCHEDCCFAQARPRRVHAERSRVAVLRGNGI